MISGGARERERQNQRERGILRRDITPQLWQKRESKERLSLVVQEREKERENQWGRDILRRDITPFANKRK